MTGGTLRARPRLSAFGPESFPNNARWKARGKLSGRTIALRVPSRSTNCREKGTKKGWGDARTTADPSSLPDQTLEFEELTTEKTSQRKGG
jgi:hypothetical protein